MPKLSLTRSLSQSASVLPMNSKQKPGQQKRMQYYNKSLNPRQRAAVNRILEGQCRPIPYILFGPPGKGQSEIIFNIFVKNYKIVHSCNSIVIICCGQLVSMIKFQFPLTNFCNIFTVDIETLINLKCLDSNPNNDIRDDFFQLFTGN